MDGLDCTRAYLYEYSHTTTVTSFVCSAATVGSHSSGVLRLCMSQPVDVTCTSQGTTEARSPWGSHSDMPRVSPDDRRHSFQVIR